MDLPGGEEVLEFGLVEEAGGDALLLGLLAVGVLGGVGGGGVGAAGGGGGDERRGALVGGGDGGVVRGRVKLVGGGDVVLGQLALVHNHVFQAHQQAHVLLLHHAVAHGMRGAVQGLQKEVHREVGRQLLRRVELSRGARSGGSNNAHLSGGGRGGPRDAHVENLVIVDLSLGDQEEGVSASR